MEPIKKKIVFLCSGGGGNLRFLYYSILNGLINDVEIIAVITDRECAAKDFAVAKGIHSEVACFNDEGQLLLLQKLKELGAYFLISTVHKILKPPIIEEYRNRILNVHYSLLPAFGGLIGARPVEAAINYGAQFTGVTCHFVDETLDGGKPIVQIVTPINANQNLSSELMDTIFRCGCIALLLALKTILNKTPSFPAQVLTINEHTCLSSAPIFDLDKLHLESFWSMISETIYC